MKVGILAGGRGTRIAEETEIKPKPMVEIGGRPILWHIMRHYAHFGHKDFFVALGYKGHVIKKYMVDDCTLEGDVSIDFKTGEIRSESDRAMDWTVTLVDTGLDTMTGGRIKRLSKYLGDGTFMLTWGDGLSDVDLDALLRFHRNHGKLATVTTVRPPARYGHMIFDGDRVVEFSEKPQAAEGWVNGAFFILEPGIFEYIDGDATQFEHEPLQRLAQDGQLMAYRHHGFWQCMDTLREKHILQTLWEAGSPPWRLWE